MSNFLASGKVIEINISEIYQRNVVGNYLEELTQSILEMGQLQPIIVKPIVGKAGYKYTVVDGNSRLEVFKKLERTSIYAVVVKAS